MALFPFPPRISGGCGPLDARTLIDISAGPVMFLRDPKVFTKELAEKFFAGDWRDISYELSCELMLIASQVLKEKVNKPATIPGIFGKVQPNVFTKVRVAERVRYK